jgi:hypothetical protein
MVLKIVWRNPVERAVILSNNGVLHDPLPTTEAEVVFNLPNDFEWLRMRADSADPASRRLGDRRRERRSG